MRHLNVYNNMAEHDTDDGRASDNTVSFIRDINKVIYNPIYVWDGTFADPEVARILHTNGLIENPTYSTKEELALITDEDMMVYNEELEEGAPIFLGSTITTFDEFQYFTGLTTLFGTFVGCTSLVNAPIIPEGVTNMLATFYYCSSLIKAPIIPEGVTDMSQTFDGCSSLIKAPIIPEGVTDMSETFYGCSSLNGIYIINPLTPPTYSASLTNVVSIYVPDESVDLYKNEDGWADYADKIFPMSEQEGGTEPVQA